MKVMFSLNLNEKFKDNRILFTTAHTAAVVKAAPKKA